MIKFVDPDLDKEDAKAYELKPYFYIYEDEYVEFGFEDRYARKFALFYVFNDGEFERVEYPNGFFETTLFKKYFTTKNNPVSDVYFIKEMGE